MFFIHLWLISSLVLCVLLLLVVYLAYLLQNGGIFLKYKSCDWVVNNVYWFVWSIYDGKALIFVWWNWAKAKGQRKRAGEQRGILSPVLAYNVIMYPPEWVAHFQPCEKCLPLQKYLVTQPFLLAVDSLFWYIKKWH